MLPTLKSMPTGAEGYWAILHSTLDQMSNPEGNKRSRDNMKVWEQALPDLKGKTFLDAGCLGGFMYWWLTKYRGETNYFGIDNWTEAIRAAKALFPGRAHCFWEADIFKADEWPWRFDIIWCAQIVQSDDAACEMFNKLWPLANEGLIFAHPCEASKLSALARELGDPVCNRPIDRFHVISLWKDKQPQALTA